MRRTLLTGLLTLVLVSLVGCGTAVPDVKGMTVDQAKDALEGAGFALGEVVYDATAVGAPDAVVAQEPAAGERAKGGSTVVLTVAGSPTKPTSDAKAPDKPKTKVPSQPIVVPPPKDKTPSTAMVTVPDVLSVLYKHKYTGSFEAGTIYAEVESVASEVCATVGLKCAVEFQSILDADRQLPKAGAKVPPGSTVQVWIGVGD
jgi:beta-lactam-binding protein with PASTA domain